ncbi:MAG: hypothetical protein AAGD25_14505 [Cyanobacteria bacterium P01_F01_bin.150]
MFRRIAFASAIALGSLCFATTARADLSETIEFGATVEFQCEFTNTVNGVLGFDAFPATVLSSQQGDGLPGSTYLLCNGDADLLKEAGQESGPPLASPVDFIVDVDPDGVEAGENTKLTVNLDVDNNGTIIEPGDYTFFVTLTAVPE